MILITKEGATLIEAEHLFSKPSAKPYAVDGLNTSNLATLVVNPAGMTAWSDC